MSGSEQSDTSSNISEVKPIVIIGMGPAGWAQAFNLIKRGCNKIVIIDKRENPYDRFNSVALSPTSLEHILNNYTNYKQNGYSIRYTAFHTGKYSIKLEQDPTLQTADGQPIPRISQLDKDFFALVESRQCSVPIPEVQKYLKSKAQELAKESGCELTELYKDVVRVKTEVAEPQVILSNADLIKFSHLFVATGGNDLDRPGDKAARKLPIPWLTNKTHCAILLKLDEKVDPVAIGITERKLIDPYSKDVSKLTTSDVEQLRWFGWEKANVPRKFCEYNEKERTFYFVGECPDIIDGMDEMQKKQALTAWATKILQIEYPNLGATDLALAQTQHNAASTFKLKTSYIKNPFARLGENHTMFLVGDALFKPFYVFGHGVEFALRSTHAAASCFKNGKFVSEKNFQRVVPILVRDYMRMTNLFNLMTALKSFNLFYPVVELAERGAAVKAMVFNYMPTNPLAKAPSILSLAQKKIENLTSTEKSPGTKPKI